MLIWVVLLLACNGPTDSTEPDTPPLLVEHLPSSSDVAYAPAYDTGFGLDADPTELQVTVRALRQHVEAQASSEEMDLLMLGAFE